MDETVTLVVPEECDGWRADVALARLMPDQSRSSIGKLLEQGLVEIEGEPVTKRSHRVSFGQKIAVRLPSATETAIISQDLPLEILYQDSDLAVINKQAGIVVHPAAGHSDQTLVNALLFHLEGLSGISGEIRPGIVHRLDKETSGVMVIAKNDSAHRKLTEAWGTEAVVKEYLALVYGAPKESSGKIEAPIGRDPRDRKRMAVVAGGRAATTLYEVVEQLRYVSLLRCRLKTGRTHQIRVHLKALGHPIIGDATYSGPQWRGIPDKRLQRIIASMERQALHAARLTFPHPATGERMTFEAPLPSDFQNLLAALR